MRSKVSSVSRDFNVDASVGRLDDDWACAVCCSDMSTIEFFDDR